MVFSSLLFIFRFLPFALILYFIVPHRLKNVTLLILSLLFYSWGEPKYLLLMLASILVDYSASLLIFYYRKNKFIKLCGLLASILFNMGTLFFFKYASFFATNINTLFGTHLPIVNYVLPLGISFYTFQTLSYTIDVYQGKVPAERNILTFATFVTLFPQLIAGPIVKYTDINDALHHRKISLYKIEEGLKYFVIGLGKKVLIANNIGSLWSEIQRIGFHRISTPLAWLSIAAFSFQIYFDFSGYSTMAIGLGKILGFEFPQNFNFPYISRSITEFWRRWHITLSSWFKEYVYIPLGGNRVGPLRLYLNLFIVWALTGLWHGASWNFVLWGLFFYIILSIEKSGLLYLLDQMPIISHIYTIFLLLISWAIFSTTDFTLLKALFHRLFIWHYNTDFLYYLRSYFLTFCIAITCSTKVPLLIHYHLQHHPWLMNLLYIAIFILSTAYLVDATYNPFLYFRF
nr:MBOAT family O-acyltransferase [uncultured Cellulosilyticum sp.]